MPHTERPASSTTVAGYFDDQHRAKRALDTLREAGFSSAHIGLTYDPSLAAAYESTGTKHAERAWDKVTSGNSQDPAEPPAPGAAVGRELTGGSTSTAASSYSRRDLRHSLIGMGLTERRARYFSRRLQSAATGAVITVSDSERSNLAESILRDNGADLGENPTDPAATAPAHDYLEQQPETSRHIAAYTSEPGPALPSTHTGEVRPSRTVEPVIDSEDSTLAAPHAALPPQPEVLSGKNPAIEPSHTVNETDDMQNIQLLGEVLRVHKQKIDHGEVVVRKEVVTETQTIQVPVRREELVIEQQPAPGETQPGQQIRIPLSEERASIEKRTVMLEEVAFGKKTVQEMREMTREVQHEELVIDDRTKRAVNE